jgi:hypothetical protein
MNANLTEIQNQVVDALARKGFSINSVDDSCGETTVFMSKRVKPYSTRYAEVDSTGLVNGLALPAFIQSLNA